MGREGAAALGLRLAHVPPEGHTPRAQQPCFYFDKHSRGPAGGGPGHM